MIDNCKIIDEDSAGIIIEIDLSEHRRLSEDLTNNFFSKKLGTTKYKEKNCPRYFVGNVFSTIKIYNDF